MSTAEQVRTLTHLGSLSIDTIRKIRPTDYAARCAPVSDRGDIQAFMTRYGAVVMDWSEEGQYWFNVNRHPQFSSIIVLEHAR